MKRKTKMYHIQLDKKPNSCGDCQFFNRQRWDIGVILMSCAASNYIATCSDKVETNFIDKMNKKCPIQSQLESDSVINDLHKLIENTDIMLEKIDDKKEN